MPAPNASYSITMRTQLDADPRSIGRITTAVGDAAGTVAAVDVVESTGEGMVVDLTCNAGDADRAETITKAVEQVQGAHVKKVSDHNLTFLHSAAKVA